MSRPIGLYRPLFVTEWIFVPPAGYPENLARALRQSGVDASRRPYPVVGSWERYTFKVGNIWFLMMSDRNDLPYPDGRRASGGGSPAGPVTSETAAWWQWHVEQAAVFGTEL
jgi:hypothetical protein